MALHNLRKFINVQKKSVQCSGNILETSPLFFLDLNISNLAQSIEL